MKSNVSDQLKLAEAIYIDATAKCIADVSDLRDLETIRSRVKKEGLSFLTITLPQFCRDFERSLANGNIDPTLFQSFRKSGSIPAFLQGMIGLIFDRETGRIYDDLQPTNGVVFRDFSPIIESVRQICLTFKKLEIDCTPKRVSAALENFTAIEHSLQDYLLPESDYAKFLSVSDLLWGNMVSAIALSHCSPKHGPGATAERISGNQKFVWRRWHDRLEPYFPLVDNGYPLGIPESAEELKMVSIIPQEQEQPVRVVTVPKTLKGPRIIAIEPCCVQFAQHGIQSSLYEAIASYWLTKDHVNFTDQSINQQLAIKGSLTGRLATIDLSDASDRVPRQLALDMFRCNPDLRDAIDACRSTKAELPNGIVISPLLKFASMGSALCFPVEAMYFYTICVVALLECQNLPVTLRNIFNVSRYVHVYGDDIIVPTTYAIAVLDHLRKYNCKVNADKTFLSGSFRESCGVDAFNGEQVTPVYIHKLRPENRRQPDRLISWVATANLFYKKGYWRTTSLMFNIIERILGPLPYVSERSSALGRTSFLGYRSVERWNAKYQAFEVRAWVPSPVYRAGKLEGYAALSKSFELLESLSDSWAARDASHLERFALHGAVVLKRHWVPALI